MTDVQQGLARKRASVAGNRPRRSCLWQCVLGGVVISLLSGCSTMVAYKPKVSAAYQGLKYVDGVGTLSVKDADQELYMYSTFKTQGTKQPTFTIGFANNASTPIDFSPGNIKAFFRGDPVPIYSYTEKVDEIQTDKRGKQVALAILGGIAAAGAAYSASRQTYTSNYSGAIYGRGGVTRFYGHNTVRVYDPLGGLFAGAAVGGVTGLGIQQLEYNAQNEEAAANSILQENTVEPQRMVNGELILKNCCDPYPKQGDTIRFEVTTNAKVSVFEFLRVTGSETSSSPPSVQASVVRPATATHEIRLTASPAVDRPTAVVPVPTAPTVPVAMASPRSVATPPQPVAEPRPALKGGQDEFSASRLARDNGCSTQPLPLLVAKGPGFETYSVSCASGDAIAVRCEFGQCRVLQ